MFIFGVVIPADIPVVVIAETDSKSEFIKSFPSTIHITIAVIKETTTNNTIINKVSLNAFSSLIFSDFGSCLLL